MKILFIGGTGNISTDCAALLHQQGHEVLVLGRGRGELPPGYRRLQADRKDPAAMRDVLKDVMVDVVINFVGYELPEVQLDHSLFQGRVGQYIFISSATVYAKPPERLPISETARQGNVWWEYARKKQACEEWLLQRRQTEKFPLTIVRPSHTYSKRWVPNPVSSSSYTFAQRLELGKPVYVPDDGENPWTLTTSSDFAVALAGLVGNNQSLGEAFNITSDEVLTWNQIVAQIAEAVGAKSPQVVRVPTEIICQVAPQMVGSLKGDKSCPGVFDNSKVKRLVPEFKNHRPFRVGVRDSVQWLRAHPEQQNLSAQTDALIENVLAAAR